MLLNDPALAQIGYKLRRRRGTFPVKDPRLSQRRGDRHGPPPLHCIIGRARPEMDPTVGDNSQNRFAVDGRERIIRNQQRRIKEEVRAKYAEELASSGFLRRLVIRYRIRREVGRMLDKIAPPDALYASVRWHKRSSP